MIELWEKIDFSHRKKEKKSLAIFLFSQIITAFMLCYRYLLINSTYEESIYNNGNHKKGITNCAKSNEKFFLDFFLLKTKKGKIQIE